MVELRDYQKEAVQAVFSKWKEFRSTLLVQATGTGKTIVFAEIIKRLIKHGKHVLVLAHRDELIQQARDKLKMWGVDSVIEKAESHTAGSNALVTIGSVQSLKSKRLEEFNANAFDYIIIDEAHHTYSASYLNILSYFENAKILGVTATPFRGDKKDLSKIFDSVAFEYPLDKAIRDHYLCQIQVEMIPLEIDLLGVKMTAGDYQAGDLSIRLEPYLHEIASIMAHKCLGKHTVVFLPLIDTSKRFVEILRYYGLKAEEINGNSVDREAILKRFEKGDIDVLCNAMLLTEGWDCPQVDCIVNLRPTRSTTLYTQIIGRGTRICKNKKNLLVLDFLWQTAEHNLCRPINLVAKTEEVRKIAAELLESKESADLMELAEEAEERNLKEMREKALAEKLKNNRLKNRKTVDAIDYCLSIGFDEILDYEPIYAWEMEPVTERQAKAIENAGIDLSTITCKGQASQVIERLMFRRERNLCTPKQLKLLRQKGFKANSWTKEEASKVIGMLSKNQWKVPSGIDPETYRPKTQNVPW